MSDNLGWDLQTLWASQSDSSFFSYDNFSVVKEQTLALTEFLEPEDLKPGDNFWGSFSAARWAYKLLIASQGIFC